MPLPSLDRARLDRGKAEKRLRPAADAILSNPGDLAARLAPVLAHWSDLQAPRALLDAGLREAAG